MKFDIQMFAADVGLLKFNIQRFAEAVRGKRIIYLYRRLSQQAKEAAWAVPSVTENSRSMSVDADTTITKDGSIRTPGTPEIEVNVTSIMMAGDKRVEEIDDASKNGEKFEIWEVNLDEPVSNSSGKFNGTYFQGYCTSFETTSNAEDFVEISITFGLEGVGARGESTVSTTQQEAASYVFTDTVQTGA